MSDNTCPLCKNPLLEGDAIMSRQGLTFHAGCGEGSLAWPVVLESLHQRIAALESRQSWLMLHAVVCGSDGQYGNPQPVADAAPDSADVLTMLAEMTLERDKALAELAAERERSRDLAVAVQEYGRQRDTARERCAVLERLLAESVEAIRPRINRFSLGGSSSGLGPSTIDLVNRIDDALAGKGTIQ